MAGIQHHFTQTAYIPCRATPGSDWPAGDTFSLIDEVTVAFKVNYGLKKAERDRAKKAKKEAKARERDSGAAPAGTHDQVGDAAPDEADADPEQTSPDNAGPAAGV